MDQIRELKNTVAHLRGPNGCPWDQKQSHQSLAHCLIEECAELLDSIDQNNMENMCEELGDVLLQVVMHAQLAEEASGFDLQTVAAKINEKLIRRHPHVFGDKRLSEPDEVLAQWEEIKASERKNTPDSSNLFKELPSSLPALLYAKDVYKQIQKGKLDTGSELDEEKLTELSKSLNEEEAGALLFEIAAACRLAAIDPESALRRYSSNLIDKIKDVQRQRKLK